jgi:CRISP-associated protein Cas1
MEELEEEENMNLVINTFGAYLHRNGEMFCIKVDGKTEEVSARKIRSIILAEGTALSTDVIRLAIEHNIDIVITKQSGDPLARIWHGKPGSIATIRRQQLRIADTLMGVKWAKSWIVRKLDNQIKYLLEMRDKRTRLSAEMTEKIQFLKNTILKIENLQGTLEEIRGSLQGLEGSAGKQYWEIISLLLPEKYHFKERSRNPAQDEFNCLLNYAYGVLYREVERACVIAGLDPYIGFIHTDNYNKPSLQFDLVENYRIWADEIVVGLFAKKGLIQEDWFFKLQNGLKLDTIGKKGLMQVFEEYLDQQVPYNRRKVKRRETIQLDCHYFANQLLEETP